MFISPHFCHNSPKFERIFRQRAEIPIPTIPVAALANE